MNDIPIISMTKDDFDMVLHWRTPERDDEGVELLIKSDDLIDEDFCPNGVGIGVVVHHDGWAATCPKWCNYHNEYHTIEITGPFLVMALPNDTPKVMQ